MGISGLGGVETPVYGGSKRKSFPPNSLAVFPCDGKSLAIAILPVIFKEQGAPTAVWLATGTFATANRGDLRLRFLVLSGRGGDGDRVFLGSEATPLQESALFQSARSASWWSYQPT